MFLLMSWADDLLSVRLPAPSQGYCSLILFPCVAPILPLNFHHNFWDYHSVFIDFYWRFEDFRRKLQHRHIKIIGRWESSRGVWWSISTLYWGSLCLWLFTVSHWQRFTCLFIHLLFTYLFKHLLIIFSYLESGSSDFTNALPPKISKCLTYFFCYTPGNITGDCQGF